MNDFKSKVLIVIANIFLTSSLSADGLALYLPVTVAINDYGINDQSNRNGTFIGLGLAYDSSVTKNNLYNYRFGFEYNNYSFISEKITDITIVNTFGLQIYQNTKLRIWAGPRVSMGYRTVDDFTGISSNPHFKIAGVTGINYSVSKDIALSLDIDVFLESYYYGASTRLYIFYRFGDT